MMLDAFHFSRRTLFSQAAPASQQLHNVTDSTGRACRVPRVLALVVAAAALAACSDKKAPVAAAPKVTEVGVIVLQPTAQSLTAELPGRTSPFLMAEIRPQANGIIKQRLFTEGALVKAGQPLYQLDARSAEAAVNSAQAALAKSKAVAQTARSNAARNAELVKIDAISRQVHDDSQAQAAQAASDVQVAQAAVDNARVNLQYTRIETPIGGRVSLSNVTAGALVTANQATPLTTVVQLDPMYVDFTQSSTEMLQLKRDWEAGRFQRVQGDQVPVQIKLDDGTLYPHKGTLQFSGVIVNATTGSVTLRAKVPNPDGVLMPNMYVQALLPTGVAPDALLVPQQSVTRDLTGKASVVVVNGENVVEKRPLVVDRALGSQWLVQEGLKAGDRVVVDGFQRIKPGDKVNAVTVDLTAPKKVSPGKPPSMAPAAPATPAAAAQ